MTLQYHLSAIADEIARLTRSPVGPAGMLEARGAELEIQAALSQLETGLARLRYWQSAARAEAKQSLDSLAGALRMPEAPPARPARAVVCIAPGLDVVLPLVTVDRLPPMRYAAVMVGDRPVAAFRFGHDRAIVSCGGLSVDDAKMRSMSCANSSDCNFGNECRYYHDPLLWPGSTHMQHVPRSSMVKGCPGFGDTAALAEQIRELDFEQLRTLGRYAATMVLVISRVAARHSSS